MYIPRTKDRSLWSRYSRFRLSVIFPIIGAGALHLAFLHLSWRRCLRYIISAVFSHLQLHSSRSSFSSVASRGSDSLMRERERRKTPPRGARWRTRHTVENEISSRLEGRFFTRQIWRTTRETEPFENRINRTSSEKQFQYIKLLRLCVRELWLFLLRDVITPRSFQSYFSYLKNYAVFIARPNVNISELFLLEVDWFLHSWRDESLSHVKPDARAITLMYTFA